MYLQRRAGGVYYFRMGVPLSARSAVGRNEICFSLETRSWTEARLKSLPHIERFLLEFQRAASSPSVRKAVHREEQLRAGVEFSEVAEKYLLERKLGFGSEKNLRTVISRFIQIVGDRDIRLYTKKDIIAFKDALARYPVIVSEKDKQLSIEALLKKYWNSRKIGAKTINNNYLGFLKVIFNYAKINDYIEINPVEGVRLVAGEDRVVKRLPYTVEQIKQNILGSDLFRHRQDDRKTEFRYLILAGLFTGARVEELARLHLSDIGMEDGIPFIHIQEHSEDGHSLKTASSRRRVPIHPTLWERFCFSEYVERGRRDKQKYLFPVLNTGNRKVVSDRFVKWYGRYLDSVGLSDERLCYHSFRHSLKAWGRACGVDSSVIDAIQGHAVRSVSMDYGRDSYGSAYPLRVLYEGLLKIEQLGALGGISRII